MNRKFHSLVLLLALGFASVAAPDFAAVALAQTDDDLDNDSPADALIAAAGEGDLAAARRLLQAGVKVDARGDYGFTALMMASASGEVEMVKWLLARGANPALKEPSEGATALTLAQEAKKPAVVALLRGAKPSAAVRPSAARATRRAVAPKTPVRIAQARPARTKIAAPTRALPAGRAIEGGLYFRIQSYFIGTSLSINQEHFAFWPDGRMVRGVPKGGLEFFDYAAARQKEPSNTGTYRIAGNKITFNMADGKSETHDFKRVPGGFNLDGIFTSRQKSYKPNQRLAGLYDGGASASGGGTYVANVKSLEFAANGTFKGSTIGALSADTSAGTMTGSSETQDAGTYTLGGNTLVLRHKGGAVTRHTVYPYDMGGGKTAINVDGVMLHKRR